MILLFLSLGVSGCATEVKQRPGVLEAKSCMHSINHSPEGFPNYIIRSCTNTGVWIVQQQDEKGFMVAQYDFVNRDYTGPDTGGAPISIEALGGEQERSFMDLQKALNKALLTD